MVNFQVKNIISQKHTKISEKYILLNDYSKQNKASAIRCDDIDDIKSYLGLEKDLVIQTFLSSKFYIFQSF